MRTYRTANIVTATAIVLLLLFIILTIIELSAPAKTTVITDSNSGLIPVTTNTGMQNGYNPQQSVKGFWAK